MTGICSTMFSKRRGSIFSGRPYLLLLLLALPSILFAQGYFSTVSGELTDPSGAVVAGAKIVAIDLAKGFTFTVTSDNAGRYFLASLPPGVYTVTVEAPGFQKEQRTDVKVNVSENATANFHLKVAAATQSVEVEAQSQTLSTEDAVTG
jgi:Carboxypeptidase regulatory-like domain